MEYVVEAVPGMSQGAFSACPAGGRSPRTGCGGGGESERQARPTGPKERAEQTGARRGL